MSTIKDGTPNQYRYGEAWMQSHIPACALMTTMMLQKTR